MTVRRPIIGITADVTDEGKSVVSRHYANAVWAAGGLPVILPCVVEAAASYAAMCDGLVLSGGDDPITTHWGVPMHPKAKPLHPDRQAFELALLDAVSPGGSNGDHDVPTLGICLGMQLMGLHAGGRLDQHLPDTLATADLHWDRRSHEVSGELGRGIVNSHHRQALSDPGRLSVIARAPDGVIEAVRDDRRRCYIGVQWHPERTAEPGLGLDVFRRLVEAAQAADRR